jgi:hypothetical protein
MVVYYRRCQRCGEAEFDVAWREAWQRWLCQPCQDTPGCRGKMSRGKEKVTRNAAVVARRAEGLTLRAVGLEFGISQGRVRQIINTASKWATRESNPPSGIVDGWNGK